MNLDAFGIRVRRLRTIAPRPPASVSPHVRAANLGSHKWYRPGEPPPPAMVEKPFCFDLSPCPQFEFVPWMSLGLHSGKTALLSCRENGWTTNCLLWGVTRPEIRCLIARQPAAWLRFQRADEANWFNKCGKSAPRHAQAKSINPR